MGFSEWWFRKGPAAGGLARTLANAYKTYHQMDPRRPPIEVMYEVLDQRQEITRRFSQSQASKLDVVRRWLGQQSTVTLGDLAFQLSLVEAGNTPQSLGREHSTLLKRVLDEEIEKVIGFMPQATLYT